MAVNVDDIDLIAARQTEAYKEAEVHILAIIKDHLTRGIDAPTWAQDRLNAIVSLRRAAQEVVRRLAKADPGFRAAVADGYRNGSGGAALDLTGKLGDAARKARKEVPRVEVIDSLSAALIRDVGERRLNVLRHVEDVYRQTIAGAVARSVAGGITRREASQAAWQSFVDSGVTSFTDVRGRTWRLTSYVEMAVRTVTMRAAIQGQLDSLAELGIDLVIVSNEAGECIRCRPWEGKVLRIGPGPVGKVEMKSVTTSAMIEVEVAGTLEEARLAGLYHPNCTHTVRAYQPGATRPPAGPTEDPDHDKAKQRQRAIERKIRGSKEQALAALTPEAKTKAEAKVRAYQAQMRQHIKDNPKLKRLPHREEIGAGNLPPGGKAPSPAGRLPGPPPPPKTPKAKATAKKTTTAKVVTKTAPPPRSKAATPPKATKAAKKTTAVQKTAPPPPRKPPATKPEDLSISQLRALAQKHGITIPGRLTKPEIIRRIRMWEAGRPPILPGTAELRAANVAARLAKEAAASAAKAAADKAWLAAFRSLPASPRNPTVLVGRGGEKWWELIKDDTGLAPIRIRNLTLDGGSFPYTIASGSAYRIQGVAYFVEDGYASKLTAEELVRQLWEVHQTLPPDGIHHQRGYAWLAGRNPADAHWEQQYNRPGFTSGATAGDGGTHVWNRGSGELDYVTPSGMAGTLRHEFGHNMSGGSHSHGMHDTGQLWGDAGQRDETTSAQVTIVSVGPAAAGHPFTLTRDSSKGYPRGVTDYGQSSVQEDFAESIRLYLAGELGVARLTPGGPETPFYFRDVWPARAAHLDKLLPKVAAEQRKALARLGR